MASLGSLIVKVGADIGSFQSDMGRAAKIADQKSAAMKKHMVGAAKAIAAGAAVAGAAVTKMVKDSLRDADKFQKLSIAIGASTEALSQLEFAAQQSGADFESVAKGMSKLQKSIGDASNGLATQTRAFEALGVSIEDLKKLTPEDQLEVMGDALQKVTNATDRTAIAADIFGQRISVGLMPLLLQGSEGIGQLRDQADKLGLTLSQDAADGAAEFNDKMNTLKMFVVGFGRQITTVLLPTLTGLFDKLVSLGDASTFAADTGRFLSNILKTLASAGIILKNIFEAASKVMVAFAVIVLKSFKALISPITSLVKRISQAFDELSRGNFKKAAAAMGNIVNDVKQEFIDAGNAIASASTDLIGGAITDLKEGFEGVQDVWTDTADTAENILKPALQNTVVDAVKTVDDELTEVIVTAKKFEGEWPKMAKAAVEATEEIEESVAGSTGLTAVIENSFKRLDDTFQSFWSNLLKDGKFSLKGIKDLFLDTIAQMLHAALTQPIVLRIGTMMTGGLASGAANASGGLFGMSAGTTDMLGGALMAGAAGYTIGGMVFNENKNYGQEGAAVGAAAGAIIGSIIPVIGTMVGAVLGGLIGGALGSLIKKNAPKIKITGGGDLDMMFKNKDRAKFMDSDLGGFYIGGVGGGQQGLKDELIQGIRDFDSAMVELLGDNQLERVTDALKDWSVTLEGEGRTIENIIQSRFNVILGTFSEGVQEYVNQFYGLENQTEALVKYIRALNRIGGTIANFIESDPATQLAEQMEDAARTSTEKLAKLGSNLTNLFDIFDGSPEMMDEISVAIDARYRAELEYLAAINNLIENIGQSIEAQQRDIREAIQGPRSFEQIMNEAQGLRNSLATAQSPEEIANIVQQIQSLVRTAFGGLDESSKALQGDFLIAFLDSVRDIASGRATALGDAVIEEGGELREQATAFAEAIGAPLDLNTEAVDRTTTAIQQQTGVIEDNEKAAIERHNELVRVLQEAVDLEALRT